MRLIGQRLGIEGPFPGVLDTQRRNQHHHVLEASKLFTFIHHAGEPDIQRPARQAPAQWSRHLRLINRRQFKKQLEGIIDHARRRRVNEWKILDCAQLHGEHSENDRSQRCT